MMDGERAALQRYAGRARGFWLLSDGLRGRQLPEA